MEVAKKDLIAIEELITEALDNLDVDKLWITRNYLEDIQEIVLELHTEEVFAWVEDVTEHWRPEVTEHTGRIFDVYLYVDSLNVYPASTMPCVEAQFATTWIESGWRNLPTIIGNYIEKYESEMRAVKYIPRSQVEAASEIQEHSFPVTTGKFSLGEFNYSDALEVGNDFMDGVISIATEGGLI